MAAKFGINCELRNGGISSYEIDSNRVIAIAGDDTVLNAGLHLFNNVELALNSVGDGSIKEALEDLNQTGLKTQIVLSSFKNESDENEDTEEEQEEIENEEKDNETRNFKTTKEPKDILSAIDELKKCEAILFVKPKFLAAPNFNDAGVHEKLKQVAQYLRAVYAIEIDATNEIEINEILQTYSTQTAIITFQKVIRTDLVVRPASMFLLASYAKVMAQSEYGFAQTYSNRVIPGIIGIKDVIEFLQGQDCEADRLRSKGITCIIVDDGIRAWGEETCNDDMFNSIHTYVIFYTIIDTLFDAQKNAIDKNIKDILKNVVDNVEAFYRNLVGNGVIVDFELTIPAELNSDEKVAEGIIYLEHKAQEMPLLKRLTNKIYRVTDYSATLI